MHDDAMTPAEWGAYVEQEHAAAERAAWEAEYAAAADAEHAYLEREPAPDDLPCLECVACSGDRHGLGCPNRPAPIPDGAP